MRYTETYGGEMNKKMPDCENKIQQMWFLLCHKAVNNVLGRIGVLVVLQKQTSQLKTLGKSHGVMLHCTRFSPVSLQRQTEHVACLETLGTWRLWICPRWDQKQTHICNTPRTEAAGEGLLTALGVSSKRKQCWSRAILTNNWCGTTTDFALVSAFTLTTSPSLERYSSSLSVRGKWNNDHGKMGWWKLTLPVSLYLSVLLVHLYE